MRRTAVAKETEAYSKLILVLWYAAATSHLLRFKVQCMHPWAAPSVTRCYVLARGLDSKRGCLPLFLDVAQTRWKNRARTLSWNFLEFPYVGASFKSSGDMSLRFKYYRVEFLHHQRIALFQPFNAQDCPRGLWEGPSSGSGPRGCAMAKFVQLSVASL